jgi:branched-chain amino acid transport system ATP-binding protein
MASGQLLSEGTAEEVARDPRVASRPISEARHEARPSSKSAISRPGTSPACRSCAALRSRSAGEIVVVLGPNGAGKSSLIKAIASRVRSRQDRDAGCKDITSAPAHAMVRLGLAFVPQTENIFPLMSVEDNLKVACGILKPREAPARIGEMYAAFPDLARQRRTAAGNLSGGQRQMLAVARALIVHPKVLVLDEPSAGLSPKFVSMVFEMLAGIRKTGVTILIVEQNAKAALAIGAPRLCAVEGKDRHEGVAPSSGTIRSSPNSTLASGLSIPEEPRTLEGRHEPAIRRRRTADWFDDRPRRHRRDAHLLDPSLLEFRSW